MSEVWNYLFRDRIWRLPYGRKARKYFLTSFIFYGFFFIVTSDWFGTQYFELLEQAAFLRESMTLYWVGLGIYLLLIASFLGLGLYFTTLGLKSDYNEYRKNVQ